MINIMPHYSNDWINIQFKNSKYKQQMVTCRCNFVCNPLQMLFIKIAIRTKFTFLQQVKYRII